MWVDESTLIQAKGRGEGRSGLRGWWVKHEVVYHLTCNQME